MLLGQFFNGHPDRDRADHRSVGRIDDGCAELRLEHAGAVVEVDLIDEDRIGTRGAAPRALRDERDAATTATPARTESD